MSKAPPTLALDLTGDAASLQQLAFDGHWHEMARAAFNENGLAEKMAFMRRVAVRLEGRRFRNTVWLPDAQIVERKLKLAAEEAETREAEARLALATITSHPAEDFLITLGEKGEDGFTPVVAVRKTTLAEARRFATSHGFRAESFTINRNPDGFGDRVYFNAPADPVALRRQAGMAAAVLLAVGLAAGVLWWADPLGWRSTDAPAAILAENTQPEEVVEPADDAAVAPADESPALLGDVAEIDPDASAPEDAPAPLALLEDAATAAIQDALGSPDAAPDLAPLADAADLPETVLESVTDTASDALADALADTGTQAAAAEDALAEIASAATDTAAEALDPTLDAPEDNTATAVAEADLSADSADTVVPDEVTATETADVAPVIESPQDDSVAEDANAEIVEGVTPDADTETANADTAPSPETPRTFAPDVSSADADAELAAADTPRRGFLVPPPAETTSADTAPEADAESIIVAREPDSNPLDELAAATPLPATSPAPASGTPTEDTATSEPLEYSIIAGLPDFTLRLRSGADLPEALPEAAPASAAETVPELPEAAQIADADAAETVADQAAASTEDFAIVDGRPGFEPLLRARAAPLVDNPAQLASADSAQADDTVAPAETDPTAAELAAVDETSSQSQDAAAESAAAESDPEALRLRPARRPQEFAEAAVASEDILSGSAPRTASRAPHRSADFAARIAPLVTARAAEATSSGPAIPAEPQTVALPTRASVARAATIENAINLREVALIGIYGTADARRALIRLASGRFVRLGLGETFSGGWRIVAMDENSIRVQKGSRTEILRISGG